MSTVVAEKAPECLQADVIPVKELPVDVEVNGVRRIIRQTLFIVFSLFLRWPAWVILGILKPVKIFDYMFLVYPGTDGDLDGYCPRWLAKSWLFSKKPAIGGIISSGKHGRGLVVVIPNTAMELLRKKDVCDLVVKRLNFLSKLVGIRAVALAGQMPGIIRIRHGIDLDEPYVHGVHGTVFCVMETVREAIKIHGLDKGKFRIVLIGVGHVGKQLLDSLRDEGHDITGIDIQIRRKGVLLPKESYPALNKADMVIVLTPRGDDFVPYIPHLKKGSIVIDDTHPMIQQQPEGVYFYKVAVGKDDVRFFPSLPGYKSEWIPGCALEAIFSSATGHFNNMTQYEFNELARALGFFAHM